MFRLSHVARAAALMAALVPFTAADALAQGWKWSLTPYIWTTGVGVDISLQDRQVVDETIAFTDLIEDLDVALQLRFEGQTGSHGFLTDLFFVGLSKDGSQFRMPNGVSATADSKMRMSILDAAALFNPRGNQQGLTLYYGARMMVERVELDATFAAPGGPASQSADTRDTLVDALIGVRYIQPIASRLSLIGRADASTGATEYTWSAGADLAYTFGARDRFAISAGYRHLVVEFKSETPADVTMTMSGFLGGFRFSF